MKLNTVMRENEMHNTRAPLSVVLYSIKSNFSGYFNTCTGGDAPFLYIST